MSSAQAGYTPDWTGIERLLAELHASYDETETFLSREFDELLAQAEQYGESLAGAWETPVAVPRYEAAPVAAECSGSAVVPEALQAELAELREGTAALASLLHAQRELTLRHQAEWSEEHRALRGLIKNVSRRASKTVVELAVNPVAAMAPIMPAAPPAPAPAAVAATPMPNRRGNAREMNRVLDSLTDETADPVVDSVLSQFEVFQREPGRRRSR